MARTSCCYATRPPEAGGPPGSSWQTLYAGYHWDDVTDLFHVRNRVYHAGLGTWTQRDPLGLSAGVNLYEYISSNPINDTDYTGLLGTIALGCIGGLAGSGLSILSTYLKGGDLSVLGVIRDLVCGSSIGCLLGAIGPFLATNPSYQTFFGCAGIAGVISLLSAACNALFDVIASRFNNGCVIEIDLECLLFNTFKDAFFSSIGCGIPPAEFKDELIHFLLGFDAGLVSVC